MAQETDLELVRIFQQGNNFGFNELVKRYQQKVYWMARRVLTSHEDADDATQDVFVKVHDGLKSFRAESSFTTWLYRITLNVALNANRKKRIREFFPFEEQQHTGDDHRDDNPEESLLKNEYQQLLQQAIERLPPRQKLIFTMRYYDEIPYEEMAQIFEKSVGGLKANYFHAVKKIQEFMRRELK